MDGTGLLSYWNNDGWIKVNAAGFAARFNTMIPDLPANTWAILTSPRLDITAGSCFREFNASALMWALHFVHEKEVCRKSHEFLPAVSDQQDGAPERIEVDAEVDAYLAEHGYRDALSLKKTETR